MERLSDLKGLNNKFLESRSGKVAYSTCHSEGAVGGDDGLDQPDFFVAEKYALIASAGAQFCFAQSCGGLGV